MSILKPGGGTYRQPLVLITTPNLDIPQPSLCTGLNPTDWFFSKEKKTHNQQMVTLSTLNWMSFHWHRSNGCFFSTCARTSCFKLWIVSHGWRHLENIKQNKVNHYASKTLTDKVYKVNRKRSLQNLVFLLNWDQICLTAEFDLVASFSQSKNLFPAKEAFFSCQIPNSREQLM